MNYLGLLVGALLIGLIIYYVFAQIMGTSLTPADSVTAPIDRAREVETQSQKYQDLLDSSQQKLQP